MYCPAPSSTAAAAAATGQGQVRLEAGDSAGALPSSGELQCMAECVICKTSKLGGLTGSMWKDVGHGTK
jgi:hypothetical protein